MRFGRSVGLVAGALAVGVSAVVAATTPWSRAWRASPPAGYIVVLHDGVDAPAVARGHARAHGLAVTQIYEHALRGYAARIPADRLAQIRSDPRVRYVEEDGEVRALPGR